LKIVTPALWSEWVVWEHESIKSSNTYIFTDEAPKAVGDKYDRTFALNIVSSKSGNGLIWDPKVRYAIVGVPASRQRCQ
jgi:hypothetical protein